MFIHFPDCSKTQRKCYEAVEIESNLLKFIPDCFKFQ